MDAFRLLAEQRIRDAIERGDFDHIEGKGRPLDLSESAGVPPELRAAYKLLQDAGLRPKEVDLMRSIAQLRGAIERARTETRRKELEGELAKAQVELDLLLGRTVPCGCSRPHKKRCRLP